MRRVRGGPNWPFDPSEHLEIISDNLVKDTLTELIWQQSDDDTLKSFPEAQIYCDALVLDSYDNWRLPSVLELQEIIDYSGVQFDPDLAKMFVKRMREIDEFPKREKLV